MNATPPHSQRAHAKLSPSGSPRWIACPGSPDAEEAFPDEPNVFAAGGTAEHEIGEKCLVNGYSARRFLGTSVPVEGWDFKVDYEFADAVQVYLDTVRGDWRPGDVLEVEQRYALPFLPGDQFGTSDATRYRPSTKELSVYDYKGGRGVVVEPEGNSQGLCYAGGALHAEPRPVVSVEIVIVQPHAFHPAGPVRRWKIGAVEAFERIAAIAKAAERVRPGAPRRAGTHCRFCKARKVCPELRNTALAEAQAAFAGVSA